jgi:hypothetical protein
MVGIITYVSYLHMWCECILILVFKGKNLVLWFMWKITRLKIIHNWLMIISYSQKCYSFGVIFTSLNYIQKNFFLNDNYEHITLKSMHLNKKIIFIYILFSIFWHIQYLLLLSQTWFWSQTMCLNHVAKASWYDLHDWNLAKISKSWMLYFGIICIHIFECKILTYHH